MSERQAPPDGSSDSDFAIGCVAGVVSGVIGDAVGTAALLVLHPDWLFGEGRSIVTIVAGLLPGWGIALVVAVVASLVLLRLLSAIAGERRVPRSSQQLNVALIFVVPAVLAAVTLWWLTSANR